jgi:hypothetical protein
MFNSQMTARPSVSHRKQHLRRSEEYLFNRVNTYCHSEEPMWVLIYIFSYSVSPAATTDKADGDWSRAWFSRSFQMKSDAMTQSQNRGNAEAGGRGTDKRPGRSEKSGHGRPVSNYHCVQRGVPAEVKP